MSLRISDEKLLVFASIISPSKSFCLRSYIKHSSQCFITISKTSKFLKNTPLHVVFSIFLTVFDQCDETLCLAFYILHQTRGRVFHPISKTLEVAGINEAQSLFFLKPTSSYLEMR